MENEVLAKRQKLESDKLEFVGKKSSFDLEFEEIGKISNENDRLISLDVGGTHAYIVKKDLLC